MFLPFCAGSVIRRNNFSLFNIGEMQISSKKGFITSTTARKNCQNYFIFALTTSRFREMATALKSTPLPLISCPKDKVEIRARPEVRNQIDDVCRKKLTELFFQIFSLTNFNKLDDTIMIQLFDRLYSHGALQR